MVDTMNTFADRLNYLCDKDRRVPAINQGRQTTLKHEFNVSQEAVRKWLSGESTPRMEKIKNIAHFFNCRWEWLLEGQEPIYPSADEIREKSSTYPQDDFLDELIDSASNERLRAVIARAVGRLSNDNKS